MSKMTEMGASMKAYHGLPRSISWAELLGVFLISQSAALPGKPYDISYLGDFLIFRAGAKQG